MTPAERISLSNWASSFTGQAYIGRELLERTKTSGGASARRPGSWIADLSTFGLRFTLEWPIREIEIWLRSPDELRNRPKLSSTRLSSSPGGAPLQASLGQHTIPDTAKGGPQKMRKSAFLSAVISVISFGALFALQAAGAPAQSSAPSLYSRLGGFDAIAALVDDFGPRLGTDPKLARFFGGHGKESQMRQRQLAIEYICEKVGGPCLYIGRPLKNTHAGLGITESDWDMAMKHLHLSLDKLKIQSKEREEVLALVGSFKKDIVEAPAPAPTAK